MLHNTTSASEDVIKCTVKQPATNCNPKKKNIWIVVPKGIVCSELQNEVFCPVFEDVHVYNGTRLVFLSSIQRIEVECPAASLNGPCCLVESATFIRLSLAHQCSIKVK